VKDFEKTIKPKILEISWKRFEAFFPLKIRVNLTIATFFNSRSARIGSKNKSFLVKNILLLFLKSLEIKVTVVED